MDTLKKKIHDVLKTYVSDITATSILECINNKLDGFSANNGEDVDSLLREVNKGLIFFIHDAEKHALCHATVKKTLIENFSHSKGKPITAESERLIPIKCESDIVVARVRGKALCSELGISATVQTKVATVISELSRNIYQYAGTGTITLRKISSNPPGMEIIATDDGPGIQNLETIFSGKYRSKSGMGIGLIGSKKIMDEFDVATAPGKGTKITARIFIK
jgi:serine/threonine-protein kinase RsbT